MATSIPTSDYFVRGKQQISRPLEYLRGSHSTGFAESSPHLEYRSGDGYATFEDGSETCMVWRRETLGDCRVKIRYQHKRVSGTAGNVRLTGVLARIECNNVTSAATSTNTAYYRGIEKGYLLRVEDDGTPTIHLYRIDNNALTQIATNNIFALENTFYTIELRVQTNADGNNEIHGYFDGVILITMNGLVDSNAARPTDPGGVGFSGISINASGEEVRTNIDYFRVESYDAATLYIEDDFQRPDDTLLTYGGRSNCALMWEWGDLSQVPAATGSTGCPGYLGNQWYADPGSPSGGVAGPWIDLYQNTPSGEDQACGIRFNFKSATNGARHELGVVLKGSKSALGAGVGGVDGYVLVAALTSDGLDGLRLIKYVSGTPTVLVNRRYQFRPDKWYEVEVSGSLSGSDYTITAKVGGIGIFQYVDSSRITQVGMNGMIGRVYEAGGFHGNTVIDHFWMTAQSNSPQDLAPSLSNIATISERPEYVETQVDEYDVTKYPFESGHAQTWLSMRQPLHVQTVEWVLEKTEAESVRDTLTARLSDALPFQIYTSIGNKNVLLVSKVVPYEEINSGVYRVGPVDVIEYLDPTSTP